MEIYGFLPPILSEECPHRLGAGGWREDDFSLDFELDCLWVDCPICDGKGLIRIQPCSDEGGVNHD